MSGVTLSAAQRDRAVGVLLGTAAGDALGAGYEFNGPLAANHPVDMIGGGLGSFEPGEWTDDTAMAVAIAEIAATGADLRSGAALDALARRWYEWSRTAKDIGVQTSSVLSAAALEGMSADAVRAASAALHRRTGRTAGNGSLMRTAPVALAYLGDEAALAEAARTVSELTHFDPEAGDACVLWCAAIRHAVLTGALDVRVGLPLVDAGRRDRWAQRIAEAEAGRPADFSGRNGWVVAALQGAWSAIAHTPVPDDDPAADRFRADHLRLALEAAVRGGGDTDTVAAIAGGLLGAAHGASAVPAAWRLQLRGWPGIGTRELTGLAARIVGAAAPDPADGRPAGAPLPAPVPHPHDDGVWIGAAGHLDRLPDGVGVVVSLCRVDPGRLPAGVSHLEVTLADPEPSAFALVDTVRAIEAARDSGQTVFVHCADARRHTPAVAALFAARRRALDVEQALAEVCAALAAEPDEQLRELLRRLHRAGVAG